MKSIREPTIFKTIDHFSMGTLEYFKDDGDIKETRYVAMFPYLYTQTTKDDITNPLEASNI